MVLDTTQISPEEAAHPTSVKNLGGGERDVSPEARRGSSQPDNWAREQALTTRAFRLGKRSTHEAKWCGRGASRGCPATGVTVG
jgi:hypothetical protein